MSLPTHDRDNLLDLAPLYALDALDAGEAALVEAALAGDTVLCDAVDGFRQVAAILAESVEQNPSTPSPDVWERIAADVAGDTADRKPRLASVSDIRKYRRGTWLAATVSAAAVVVSLALGARVLDLQDRVNNGSIDEVAAAALSAPGSRLVNLDAAEGFEGVRATIVLTADGTGFLVSDSLPPVAADRTYQLWAVVRDGEESRVISAGVLGQDPGITQFSSAGAVEAFAITEEVAGGVVVSEGPTVVVGAVDV